MYGNEEWHGSGEFINTRVLSDPYPTTPRYFKIVPEMVDKSDIEKSSSDEKQTETCTKKHLNHKVKIKDVMVLAYMLKHAKNS